MRRVIVTASCNAVIRAFFTVRSVFSKSQLISEFPPLSYAGSSPTPTRNSLAIAAPVSRDQHHRRTVADGLGPARCNPGRGTPMLADRFAATSQHDREMPDSL